MTEKMIRDAYCKIRTIDQTIPDDVLDFMRDASIEKLKQVNKNFALADVSGRSEQLACIHDVTRLRLIGRNITCLDCKSTWVRQAN